MKVQFENRANYSLCPTLFVLYSILRCSKIFVLFLKIKVISLLMFLVGTQEFFAFGFFGLIVLPCLWLEFFCPALERYLSSFYLIRDVFSLNSFIPYWRKRKDIIPMWDKKIQAKGKARQSSQKSQSQSQRILEYLQDVL